MQERSKKWKKPQEARSKKQEAEEADDQNSELPVKSVSHQPPNNPGLSASEQETTSEKEPKKYQVKYFVIIGGVLVLLTILVGAFALKNRNSDEDDEDEEINEAPKPKAIEPAEDNTLEV